jgi:NADH dehydrogenase
MSITHKIPIPPSDLKRVVIIGGGFGGIKLAQKLSDKHFEVVLVDRHNYHTFQPLLYQVATAGLEPDSIAGPLRKQLEGKEHFYFRMAIVEYVDPASNLIQSDIGILDYDYLVIATGSKTNYFGNKSIMENAFPLKQIPQALDLRSHILQNFENAVIETDPSNLERHMNVVIVGGGPTGVEVAGALGELKRSVLPKDYPELDLSQMKIILVEGQDELLAAMSDKASLKSYNYVKKFDVDIRLECFVTDFDGEVATLSNGEMIQTYTVIWAAGVMGNIIDGLGDQSIDRSRIVVDEYNLVKGYQNIFAIGDVATMKSTEYPNGHPMMAPAAMQQGILLANNLAALENNNPLKPFLFHDKGSMATVGRNKAVVDMPGNITYGGFLAWLTWMFVHIVQIIGLRNRLVIFSNWVWNYFTYDRGTRLIIRRFTPNFKLKKQQISGRKETS